MSKYTAPTTAIESIVLAKDGDDVVVQVCVNGAYYEIIREQIDSPFNHCVHASGIQQTVKGKKPVYVNE